jgi:Tol biopolymer transport system component
LAKRTIITLLGATIALMTAAPAQAKLVYVKGPGDSPHVFVADDDGTNPHKVGDGHSPAISDDGRWVAWVTDDLQNSLQQVHLRLADRTRKARDLVSSDFVGELKFSPDSKQLGIELRSRLWVYNIHDRESVKAASGQIRGYSFSPDSASIAFGTSGHSDAFDAPSDLYAFSIADKQRRRITRDRKSLNPLWTTRGIIHDRQKIRDGFAPSYNLFEIQPDGGSLRRITALKIPNLVSGLVPLERSADGKRLLAEFEGQDTSVGFAVNPKSGKVRSLSRDSENGFVAADLTADGSTVLGVTGGPDPNNRHNVVTMPYRGGKPKVLVKRATEPDWSL